MNMAELFVGFSHVAHFLLYLPAYLDSSIIPQMSFYLPQDHGNRIGREHYIVFRIETIYGF
jgi:hypothetical protein